MLFQFESIAIYVFSELLRFLAQRTLKPMVRHHLASI